MYDTTLLLRWVGEGFIYTKNMFYFLVFLYHMVKLFAAQFMFHISHTSCMHIEPMYKVHHPKKTAEEGGSRKAQSSSAVLF